MNLTNHAKTRMKQRCGLSKKSSKRMAEKALECGIKHSETTGRLHKYMSGLYVAHKRKGADIRIYGDKVYIFCEDVLITVLQVPSDLTRDMKSMIKR